MSSKENSPLQEVLDNLNLKQSDMMYELKNHGYIIDSGNFSKYVSEKRELTSDLINAISTIYHINPSFLRKTSDKMYPEQEVTFQTFKKLVKEWTIIEYENPHHISNEETEHVQKYLHLTMDSSLYTFLINFDEEKTNLLKKYGSEFFDTAIQEHRKNYYASKPDFKEYVLIPTDDFLKIPLIGIKESPRKRLHEVLDFFKHSVYHKAKLKLRINTTKIP